jgi:molecular chaperone HscC
MPVFRFLPVIPYNGCRLPPLHLAGSLGILLVRLAYDGAASMQIIGIDLGTTNSLCSIFQDGEPRLIPNSLGEVLTPSVVGILSDGRVVVGSAAKELRVTQPERCISCFKRLMGSDQKVTLTGHTFTPAELSSLVLRSLREDASHFLGVDVTEAVITVPA